ncbi:universal stress protein [Antrihabitans sp. YC2-6]|uniref:universal stress protein n=1 Tax=Antrihabitans sp. YC2-6 TaxID=2799498 RepID=UPI0018F72955|nr:universal stress protein [Antrihabitans sp. YC2-6]MBJ8347036.1 universal stress protein [Antrihabitans sp. YC2-6]
MHNQPIVVGVDGSDAGQDAVRWAAREAAFHKCRLTIVNASPVLLTYGPGMALVSYGPALALAPEEFDSERTGRAILSASERTVESMIDEIGVVDTCTEFVAGPTIPSLLDLSKDARLLVVGNRGLGAFRRRLLGSVSTAVAHHAHCPVVVVRTPESAYGPGSSAPVVVGVDGTDSSAKAIEIAFDEASHRGVELVAVYAWTDYSDLVTSVNSWPTPQAEQEALLAECLAGWRERYPEVDVRKVAVRDRPARKLLAQSEVAQLVVVGSHGRGGFSGMTLGSTSEVLLHHVECPIIIARKQD